MKKYLAAAACVLNALQLIGQEELVPPMPNREVSLTLPVEKFTFLYGTAALVPGAGVSSRKRTGSEGTALDFKVGALIIPRGGGGGGMFKTRTIPVVSVDYNWLYFTKPTQDTSPYFSYGIGAAYIVPYVPLRAGVQFKHGFVDLGAKLILGFYPSPEVRGGINIRF